MPHLLKRINITEQINAYIRQQRLATLIADNKKADLTRQDEMSAQLPTLITKENNLEPV